MNCNPGDLAVVVRSTLGNLGKIVRVIGPSFSNGIPFGETTVDPATGVTWRRDTYGYGWVVESVGSPLVIEFTNGKRGTALRRPFPDSALRPLRDNEDEDEMLRIARKPVTQGELSECLQKRTA